MQDWDLAETRARHALDEVLGARAQVVAALGVHWRSPAGAAYRRRVEDCLRQLDAVPRELEDVLEAVHGGRASAATGGP